MNVVLIGYRGCGKTTVGRVLAQRLDADFFDTDRIIVQQAGLSIAQIFAAEGEAGFRLQETEVISDLSDHQLKQSSDVVISVGGGAVMSDDNRRRLTRNATVVWLSCPPEVLYQRIVSDPSSGATRPALTDQDGMEEVRSPLALREPYYRSWADIEFPTDAALPDAIAADIVTYLHRIT